LPPTVQQKFDEMAELFAGAAAVEGATGVVSYGELRRRADAVADRLVTSRIPRGARIPILVNDPADLIPAVLAVLKAGCIFVSLDPRLPDARLRAIVAQVEPACFITMQALSARLARFLPESPGRSLAVCLDAVEIVTEGPFDFLPAAAGDSSPLPARSEPDDPCYIYFTSGSTGRPKGIVGRLKAIDHFVRWEIGALGLGAGCRVSQLAGPGFDAWLRDVFVPLCSGGTVCTPESWDLASDPGRLARWVDEHRIEVVHCVPSVFRALLSAAEGLRFAALRQVLLAGERLLPRDVRRALEVFGPRVKLVNLYGPSETTMTKLAYFVKPEDAGRAAIPIGRPIPGARAVLVNEQQRPCAPGETGEILIRTPFRSHGYLGDRDLTRRVFISNPLSDDPDDLVFVTGDFARLLPSGDFEFLGRRDDQVKINGIRLELAEVEGCLREHPSVRDAAMLPFEGHDGTTLVAAFVVLGEEIDTAALRRFCALWLPETALPAQIVRLEQLPRTHSGKVDFAALRKLAMTMDRGEGRAALDEVESLLAGLWAKGLGVEQVLPGDDLFALGAHSLLVTRLTASINQAFGIDLPLRTAFERRTVASQAEAVRSALGGERLPAIERLPRDRGLPLSFAQERLWFMVRLAPGNPSYNTSRPLLLEGPLELGLLARSLDEVRCRHETLRTTFREVAGCPVQVVEPFQPTSPPPLIDLSALATHVAEAEARRLACASARRPFDLERGPLLRVTAFRLAESRWVLLLTMHHIVSDGWSMGLLVRETATVYGALATGRCARLAELPAGYADIAVWQRSWLTGARLERHLDFWRRELAGAPPFLELPTDHRRPESPNFRGGMVTRRLSGEITSRLLDVARGEDATLFLTLLAAFAVLLRQWAEQDDLVLGIDLLGRTQVEMEGLIGYFSTQLPVRIQLIGDPTFRQLIARVRASVLGVYANQHLPFQRLVEALRPPRDPRRNPIFQVMFSYVERQRSRLDLGGVAVTAFPIETERARFDVTLYAVLEEGELSFQLEYSRDLFEESSVAVLLARFEALLGHLSAHPEERVRGIAWSSTLEKVARESRRQTREGLNRELLRRVQTTWSSEFPLQEARHRE